MLYYCFHEPKPEQETLVVSVTEIERALNPLPENRQIKDLKKQAATFWVWNIVEDIVWTTISQWEEAWLNKCKLRREYMNPGRMEFYSSSWQLDKQFKFLYDWMEQIVNHVKCYKWEYNLRNHNCMVEVDYSGYKVIVKWECDWWIDWEILFDCKTSKTKWDELEKQLTSCYQARYYTWMQMLVHPELQEMDFVYRIFTKQKTIQFQEMIMHMKRDWVFEFVRSTLFEYLKRLKKWEIVQSSSALDRL